MHIAILTFDGFNKRDSLIALSMLNRIKTVDWRVVLSCPTPMPTSNADIHEWCHFSGHACRGVAGGFTATDGGVLMSRDCL